MCPRRLGTGTGKGGVQGPAPGFSSRGQLGAAGMDTSQQGECFSVEGGAMSGQEAGDLIGAFGVASRAGEEGEGQVEEMLGGHGANVVPEC